MVNIISLELAPLAPENLSNGKLPFTTTMVSALATSAIIILLALIVRIFFIPRWKKQHRKKSGFRVLLEYLVNTFDSTAKDTTGHNSKFVGPWYFAAAGFICIGTLIELIGLRPVVSDLNCAIALGITTFILIHFLSFKERKVKRLLHYINPINLITDTVLPFSMALRMFGSVFSGYLIMHLLYGLNWYALIGIPALASVMFTLFHALIQSYIFMFLSMSFINEACE